MKIFESSTYQEAIKSYIESQKTLGKPLTYQQVATELRIQKSYLSKVMAGNASINKDQAYLLAKLMKLNSEERGFLFLLVERDRAALKEYRQELDDKVKGLQLQNTQSTAYLNKQRRQITSAAEQLYYLYPEIQLVHLAFGLAKYQKDPESLRKELGLGEGLYAMTIKNLEELGLISINEGKVELAQSNLHLPNDSELFHQWQTQFKLKSVEWVKRLETKDKYNFVASFTASEEDKEKIRLEFMKFLKKAEKIVKDAPAEGLYQINFDLFKWL